MFKKFLIIFGIIIVALIALVIYFSWGHNKDMKYGVTYSWEMSNFLGLDNKDAFKTVLDEWGFRYIRLPVYWDSVEHEKDKMDFAELDWLMDEAAKRDAKIILAVGQKTPRWPECHTPEWAKNLNDDEFFAELKKYITRTVGHYQNHPALEIWQVENEPFLGFGGECRRMPLSVFKDEVTTVKEKDPLHLTLVSDSGELSTWWNTARAADLFGTTMYRVVWNRYIGYFNYDWLPPAYYRFKAVFNGRKVTDIFITELQAEPWLAQNNFNTVPLEEQYISMNLERLKKNTNFAERVGVPRTYLWGAEWWYWLKQRKLTDISDYIGTLPK